MDVRLNGSGNIYEQIISEYKKLISRGIIENGEFLPSCRDLAKQLGVNPNTVSKAYSKLEMDGYVTTVPKKGVYVSYLDKEENEEEKLLREHIEMLRKKGMNYDKILSIINSIYGRDTQ